MFTLHTYAIMAKISGLIACVIFASVTLWAQTTGTGTIVGTVTDTSGAVVPDAQSRRRMWRPALRAPPPRTQRDSTY